MTTITTRSGKGSPLTNDEVDANFTGLNTDKVETSGDSMTGDLSFGDNNKVILGAGSDLQIYHSGSSSFVRDLGDGDLNLWGTNVTIGSASGNLNLTTVAGGATTLLHGNAAKLATSSTGIDVSGTVTVGDSSSNADLILTEGYTNTDARIRNSNGILEIDADLNNEFANSSMMFAVDGVDKLKINNNGDISFYEDTGTTAKLTWNASAESLNFADNGKAVFGAGSDLQIYHDGSDSYIKDTGVGNLYLDSSDTIIRANGAENSAKFIGNGRVELYYDAVKKFETSSTGINVTGTVTADGMTLDGELLVTGGGSGSILVNDEDSSLCPTMTFLRNGGGTTTNDFIKFENSTGEVAAINSSGGGYFTNNVGIGTSAPSSPLTVDGTITIGTGTGTYQAGSLGYSDSNWGFLHRPPQAGAIGAHAFQSYAGSSLMAITDGGNVGIGTAEFTDSYKMIIEGSDQETGDLTDAGTHGATLFLRALGENVGSGGAVAFGTTNSNKRPFAAIKGYVLDGTANSVGDLVFSTRATTSATALTERMTLTNSGRLVIGINSPLGKLDVQSDGQYTPAAYFRNDGNATGWARADWYNDQAIGSGIVYRDQAGSFVFRNDNSSGTAMTTRIVAGGTTAGNIVFNKDATGTGEVGRFDTAGHLIVPNGITLGTSVGTYSADKTLDDYEEGAWTPTISTGTVAYTAQRGRYTKIGRVVHIHCFIQISSISGSSGTAIISGLPFVAKNDSNYSALASKTNGFNWGGSATMITFQVVPNTAVISAVGSGNNIAFNDVNSSGLSANDWIAFSGHYVTDS